MKLRHLLLLVLAFGTAIASLLAHSYGHSWIEGLMSNLAAGFAGSFLTVLLIDSALERERDRQTARVRNLAFSQVRPLLLQQLDLVGTWRKVSAAAVPTPTPTTVADLFDPRFYEDVLRCDFSRDSGTTPSTTWYSRTAATLSTCRAGLEQIIDHYAVFLDSESLEALEAVAHAHFVNFVVALGPNPHALGPMIGGPWTDNLLAGGGVTAALRDYIAALIKLTSIMNEYPTPSVTVADLNIWRPDVMPAVGSARMTDDQMLASNPRFFMGAGLPSAC